MANPGPRYRSKLDEISGSSSLRTCETTANTPLVYPSNYTTRERTQTDSIAGSIASTMSDVVVKDFHKLRAKGYIFNNPMEKTKYSQTQGSADILSDLKVWQCAYDHSDWSKHFNLARDGLKLGTMSYSMCASGASSQNYLDLPSLSVNVSSLQDQAISKAWANINQNDLLALASVKEAQQTIHGLFETARKVVKIFKVLKRFNVKKAAGLLYTNPRQVKKKLKSVGKQTEDMYMEARYNLRPLYYDMLGLLKLTGESVNPRQTFRGDISDVAEVTDNEVYNHTGVLNWNIGTGVKLRQTRIASRSVDVRAGVLTDLFDQNLAHRLGLSALAETTWDLIPFSFIVDWFFNVGNTLLAWTPKPGARVLTSWVTVKQIDTCFNEISLDSYDPGAGPPSPWAYAQTGFTNSLLMSPAWKKWQYETLYRLPHPSRPVIPSFNLNLDFLKLTDLFIIIKKMVSYSR